MKEIEMEENQGKEATDILCKKWKGSNVSKKSTTNERAVTERVRDPRSGADEPNQGVKV